MPILTWVAARAALARVPWRAVGAVGLVLAAALAGQRVSTWRAAYVALPGVQAKLELEASCGEGSECARRQAEIETAHALTNQKVILTYEHELEGIRNRPVPATPIRLCRPAKAGSNVRVPGAAGGTGAGPGAELPLEIGRDIAIELYQLADDADTEALKLRSLWGRDLALSVERQAPSK